MYTIKEITLSQSNAAATTTLNTEYWTLEDAYKALKALRATAMSLAEPVRYQLALVGA